MSMADSTGTDVHVRASILCLSPPRPRSLNPSALNYPFPPVFSASRGNGKWGFAISLTFEHSSLSRSRPQREICLPLPFSHPAFPIVASHSVLYGSCKSLSSYSILQVSLRAGSSFYTICPFRMNLMDGWLLIRERYEWRTDDLQTALFSFLSLSCFFSLNLSSFNPLLAFEINLCFISSSPSNRRCLSRLNIFKLFLVV